MAPTFKSAMLQMRAVAGDMEANFATLQSAAKKAAAQGADLLVAPELALSGYGAGGSMRELANAARAVRDRIFQLSARLDLGIITGFPELDGDTVYNSALFATGAGGAFRIYRKSHLYGPYEQGLFKAASPSSVVTEWRGLKIGMLICYDVEFPENVRKLAQAGADLVVVPTALPASDHDEFIARKMIPVRAFENQVFVAYVNLCGGDPLFTYAGLSTLAAPDGSVLAAGGKCDEELLIAEIRPQDFAGARAANPYLDDLRV